MGAVSPQAGRDGLAKNEGALGDKHRCAWLKADGLSWEVLIRKSRRSQTGENKLAEGNKSSLLLPGFTPESPSPRPWHPAPG